MLILMEVTDLVAADWADPHVLHLIADRAGVDDGAAMMRPGVRAHPEATRALAGLLALGDGPTVEEALEAESLAYSTLLGGPEFAAWRAERPRRAVEAVDEPVLVGRDGDRLVVTLNRPERRNAFGRAVRDGLLSALDVAAWDADVTEVVLTGAGPAFCSGGDLDEFGIATDLTEAHRVRMAASAGLAVHRLRDRVRPVLHGACVGAGIEVPAFAAHVTARADAFFQLPELRMGLVPGAGGTVSVTRRIGPWRTAYLVLSGVRIDAVTALEWGLVDELAP